MKVAVGLAILLFTGLTLMSQAPYGTVAGTVVDAYSQVPIASASVQVPGIGQSTTDETGRFHIVNIPPGRYVLQAIRSGMTQVRADRASGAITVTPGGDVRNVLLRMAPFGVIRGRVRDDGGNPLSGISIQALVLSYQKGRRVFNAPSLPAGILNSTTETDENGEYRLEVPAGVYFLCGQGRPSNSGDDAAIRVLGGTRKTYYPGTTDAAFAIPIPVSGQTAAGIDFKIATAFQATHKVHVRVEGVARASRPFIPAGAQIAELQDRFSMERLPVMGSMSRGIGTASQELVIEGVPDGSFDLYMDGAMEGGVRGRGMTPIDIRGEDLHDVVIFLQPAQDIAGRIAGVDSSNPISLSGLSVQLGTRSTGVKRSGEFAIPAVLTGKYPVTVEGLPPEAYIADIRYGGISLHETARDLNGPELHAGLSGTPLQILLAYNGGAVEGMIEQREAAAGATVVLVPNPSRRFVQSDYKTAVASPAGSFSFKGVPPGIYQLFAWESVPDTAWLNPEFMSRWNGRGTIVSVEAEGRVNVRTHLIARDD